MKTILSPLLHATLGLVCLAPAQRLNAVRFQELFSFPLGPANPYGELVQGADGAFYGTTSQGGTNGQGAVIRVTTNGAVTLLASLNSRPEAGLTQGPDGAFYGTTAWGSWGEPDYYGTVFRVTTNGEHEHGGHR